VTHASIVDRTEVWLTLLREVTRRFPRWVVYKNIESALTRHGDVDSLAPAQDWPGIARVWRDWVADQGMSPAILCRHVPQGPHFVTLSQDSDYLVQFDVKLLVTYRGSTLMSVDDVAELVEMDRRGFRRIRPGAEGVLKLVYNGSRSGGRMDPEGLRIKRVLELLESDPEGVRGAARLFGPAEGAVIRAVERLIEGEWSRASMAAIEGWAYLKATTELPLAAGRLWFNQVAKKECPVLQVIREHDRRVPEDREAWLRRVEETHALLTPWEGRA
jgi:hypothetical protein